MQGFKAQTAMSLLFLKEKMLFVFKVSCSSQVDQQAYLNLSSSPCSIVHGDYSKLILLSVVSRLLPQTIYTIHLCFKLTESSKKFSYGRLKAGESDDINVPDCWLLNRLNFGLY